MRTIESQLHEVLLDIAPDIMQEDEQALVIAEAAVMFRRVEARESKRTAARHTDPGKLREARLTDALLQAMSCLASWSDADEEVSTMIDGRGLDPSQIVARASFGTHRTASTGFEGMNLLNDKDLSVFMDGDTEGHGAEDYLITDSEPNHPESLYFKPGTPRHRSDSLAR